MAYPMQIITTSSATTLSPERHGETLVVMASTTGFTVTMPSATGSGDRYRVAVSITVSSGNHVIAAAGTDVMMGAVMVATDIAGVTCPTTATSDKITMSGSTTGGVLGSYVDLQDVASGKWLVTGSLVSTGAEATPFSET
jgi:hypothetical protein